MMGQLLAAQGQHEAALRAFLESLSILVQMQAADAAKEKVNLPQVPTLREVNCWNEPRGKREGEFIAKHPLLCYNVSYQEAGSLPMEPASKKLVNQIALPTRGGGS